MPPSNALTGPTSSQRLVCALTAMTLSLYGRPAPEIGLLSLKDIIRDPMDLVTPETSEDLFDSEIKTGIAQDDHLGKMNSRP